MSSSESNRRAVVIGGGPAGLMAAERLALAGVRVDLYDAMASVGRKFLLAGKGGLNLTHSEPRPAFDTRYFERQADIAPWLDRFDGDALRAWAQGLGVETFVGTSGRVFPQTLKAAPMLRAWLSRLRTQGVSFHMRHRWLGWTDDGALRLQSPDGEQIVRADAVVLALGGASWPQLGSDGAWAPLLGAIGADVAPLRAANCGFDLGPRRADAPADADAGWSPFFAGKFAGQPLKPVALTAEGLDGRQFSRQGEFVVTATGIEGSLVYAVSALLREVIEQRGEAVVHLDLLPGRDAAWVEEQVAHPRGSRSMSSHLKSRLNLEGLKAGLLHEVLSKDEYVDTALLARTIKALPLRLRAARPVAEAISTAGGVRLESLDAHLMLKSRPGLFVAGEMLDWEAPTGGYLLTAALASGLVAGEGAVTFLR
ncbi:aminoacetone oxidase family FAD-binding enzyme [Roseateles aquatilis]|uniref:Aminoacetone oxidase family FAD-binding enzyme n=1 Tax=Roseateles aquatilis TaxID=431061 RepID=A0A246JL54_9BURK|nr:TIGR03862 family flavoprotein [Roseateles aquatilis]OWQ93376.1 aminoacetone oxidase family FAD-binding enzyme [Roseateles aquatilis]